MMLSFIFKGNTEGRCEGKDGLERPHKTVGVEEWDVMENEPVKAF